MNELPAQPGKIIAVHLSYRSRAAQRGRVPTAPSYFLKPSSSIASSGQTLRRPAGAQLLAFEGEIALVIGRESRWTPANEAWAAVAGVTAANDLGVYDLRAADKGSNLRAKGGDGFTPLGPRVLPAHGLDPGALRVRSWVNGQLRQEGSTEDLLFPFAQIIADLSQTMTLHPGDVILTGTPAGSSVIVPGDVVEVEVDAPTAPGAPSTGRLLTRIGQSEHPFDPGLGDVPRADEQQRREAWGQDAPAGGSAGAEDAPAAEDAHAAAGASSGGLALAPGLRELLLSAGVGTLSAQLRRRGYVDGVFVDGVLPNRPGVRIAGLARTLRLVPFRPDLFASHGGGHNAQKRAFDSVLPGEVIVIEARGERGAGTLGDLLALRAQQRGAEGVVTDGGVRDHEAVAALGLPVFSAGPHPSVLGRRHVPWETDVTIACGGATVQPGDVIVGDGDGVIVIPPVLAAELAADALAQEREDDWVAQQLRHGARLEGLFPPDAAAAARYREETGQGPATGQGQSPAPAPTAATSPAPAHSPAPARSPSAPAALRAQSADHPQEEQR